MSAETIKAVAMTRIIDNSTIGQRATIKACLREGPHSTLEFRAVYGICSPAARIQELRKAGYEISTHFITETDQAGVTHKGIAVYTLLSEPNSADI